MWNRISLLVIFLSILLASVADGGMKRRVVVLKDNGSMKTSTVDTLLTDVGNSLTPRVSILDPVTGFAPDSVRVSWTVLDSSKFYVAICWRQVNALNKLFVGSTIDSAAKTAETDFVNVNIASTSVTVSKFNSIDEIGVVATGVATNTATPVAGTKGKYSVRLEFFYTINSREYP